MFSHLESPGTATAIRRGQTGQVIRIPVMEGQYTRADRNQRIGSLEIAAEQIKRDLPTGSEVEITIEIDSSRLVRTKAFVPILDEEFEQVISYENYRNEASDPEALKREVERQNKRLDEAREKARQTGDLKARQAVQRIDAECMVREVEISLAASHADPDAADKCQYRLLDLKSAIDEVEEAVEWPILVAEAKNEIEVERKIVNNQEYGVTVEEKTAFKVLDREIYNRHYQKLKSMI